MKEQAYLFGPFCGELQWEYFHFAPYAIHLKKKHENVKIVVLTRKSRFDLYGTYADILIPLKIENENMCKESKFCLDGFNDLLYENIADLFKITYKKRYELIDHFYPDISEIRKDLKWQFPRSCMDYDFIPRMTNTILVNIFLAKSFTSKKKLIILDEGIDYKNDLYHIVKMKDFMRFILDNIDNEKVTYIGCVIDLLKKSNLVISSGYNDISHLSLLLKKPLISKNIEMSCDALSLLNPYKTPIVCCDKIEEGVEIYENNF